MSEAVTSLDQLENGYYLMYHMGHGSFIREETNHALMGKLTVSGDITLNNISSTFVGSDKSLMSSVVLITKNPNGTYKMQFSSGQYLGRTISAKGDAAYSNFFAGDLQIASNGTGTFAFRPLGQNWADCNGVSAHSEGSLTSWSEGNTTPTSSNSKFQFYPVKLASSTTSTDYVTITVNAKFNDAVVATTTADVETGSTYSGDAFANVDKNYFTTVSTVSNQEVSESNKTFEVNVQEGEVPFTFSTADAPVWYTIHFREDQNHYLCHVLPSDQGIGSARAFTSSFFGGQGGFHSFNGALWAFVREGLGVKLLCKQTGTYVNFTSSANNTAAVLDATGMEFYVRANNTPANKKTQDGFSLQLRGATGTFLGDHASNGRFGLWANGTTALNDGGSCLQINPAETSDVINIGKASMTANPYDYEVKSNATIVVAASALTLENVFPEIQTAANADAATTLAELDAAYEAGCAKWNELKNTVYIPTDGYYRIKNANLNDNQKTYISSEKIPVGTTGLLDDAYNADQSINRKVQRATGSDNLVSQIWKFENAGNGSYYVRNTNTDRYFSNASPIDMPIQQYEAGGKGAYTFKAYPDANVSGNDGFTIYQMQCGGHSLNAYAGNTGADVANWDNHDTDKGNYWQIIKVTSIPVAIGETGWTSVCYPFEVTIPSTSTVKAYYAGKPSNGYVALTEVANGVIPANTGVFLVNESGAANVNLDITSTGATVPEDVTNSLQGATAQRVGFGTEGATYLLGLTSSNEPALLKSKLNWVPANKAYLPATTLTNGVSVLSFGFGQNTGISDAVVGAESDTETYYDLNGCVVLYPQHGIFVTKSGRKVYIK